MSSPHKPTRTQHVFHSWHCNRLCDQFPWFPLTVSRYRQLNEVNSSLSCWCTTRGTQTQERGCGRVTKSETEGERLICAEEKGMSWCCSCLGLQAVQALMSRQQIFCNDIQTGGATRQQSGSTLASQLERVMGSNLPNTRLDPNWFCVPITFLLGKYLSQWDLAYF